VNSPWNLKPQTPIPAEPVKSELNRIVFEDTDLPNIIELKNINMTYDEGKSYIIKDLNFLIEDKPNQSQFVVLLGVSGSGKSTVLRFVCGLQKPTSGEVLIHGKPRDDSTRIGMVFQQYSSFPWLSVLDNVALGLKYKGVSKKDRYEKAMEMIKLVGLDGQEKKYAQYPHLSGGQLQRVALARSLVSNPQILLFDEPHSALDVRTRSSMQLLLADLWVKMSTGTKDLTALYVTHDIPEAVFLADEIWIMRANPGTIIERIVINLPFERTIELKRTQQFTDIVYTIEDKLRQISSLS